MISLRNWAKFVAFHSQAGQMTPKPTELEAQGTRKTLCHHSTPSVWRIRLSRSNSFDRREFTTNDDLASGMFAAAIEEKQTDSAGVLDQTAIRIEFSVLNSYAWRHSPGTGRQPFKKPVVRPLNNPSPCGRG